MTLVEIDLLLGKGIVDPQGRTVLQAGLLATLYFEHGHSLDKRLAVAACLEDYRAVAGHNLRWAHPGRKGFDRLDGLQADGTMTWLSAPEHDEHQGWELTLHGGETDEEASHFMFRGLGARSWQSDRFNALSFITFALPHGHAGDFPGMLLHFCERLRPLHGYGGFGLVESPNRFLTPMHESTVYSLAERHPGLEIDNPIIHSIYVKDGIKGVNWLTVLGEHWLPRLGGVDALRSQLGASADVQAFAGGCLIMAGAKPQLGDGAQGPMASRYALVARALAPVRIRKHGRLQSYGAFGQEEYEAWLTRFDHR